MLLVTAPFSNVESWRVLGSVITLPILPFIPLSLKMLIRILSEDNVVRKE